MQPDKVPRDVAIGLLKRWLGGLQQQAGGPVQYVVALEYQKNGWPHFHPLLSFPFGLKDGMIRAAGNSWYRMAGLNKLEVPRNVRDTAEYAGKYLAKDFESGDVVVSNNLRCEFEYETKFKMVHTSRGSVAVPTWVGERRRKE